MSIARIRVHVICDACDRIFYVEMDLADTTRPGQSIYDLGVAAIRGSLDYEEPGGRGTGSSSVQHGQQLCDACTGAASSGCTDAADQEAPDAR